MIYKHVYFYQLGIALSWLANGNASPFRSLRNSSIFSGRDEPARKLFCGLAGSLWLLAVLRASSRKGLSCRVSLGKWKRVATC